MTAPVVGFAGLTHLGLVSAAAAAAKGFRTVAYDGDGRRVAAIAEGRLPVQEPELDALIEARRDRLAFTAERAALASCDVVYVATDVPTDDRGRSDLSGIEALIRDLLPVLAPDAVLVVLCQVPPGFTRQVPFPATRRVYQVETLVFGRAVERALHPERFILGVAEPEQPLPPALAAFLDAFDCPRLVMRYESAELAKIAINCCLAASVSVANTLAELSERIGADWAEVVPALRLDRRIGPHAYLAPGLGLAGGNIERDLTTVLELADRHGTDASAIAGIVASSRHSRDWAWRAFRHAFPAPARPRVAVLGLAYKENTHSTKNSVALDVLTRLEGGDVAVYDPVVPAGVAPFARSAESALAAAAGAEAVLILTPWPEFRQIDPAALARVMAGRVVIDPYRCLDVRAAAAAGLDHRVRGMPPGGGRNAPAPT